jgi:tRNA dimethylallyltransferase
MAKTVLIAGPTGSGKSGLALALAQHSRGIVINADSMQVYRELRILTARPTVADEMRVPHMLYGFVAASDAYSAGRYLSDAAKAIGAAHASGRPAIVVGGTGLYFKALLHGLSPIPAVPQAIRAHWRAEAARFGAANLHAELAKRDPEMAAKLKATDRQRVIRALEVLDATQKSLLQWQRQPGAPFLNEEQTIRLVLVLERAELYCRCNARFDVMMQQGALEEVRALARLDLDPQLPVMRALGVRPFMALLAGRVERERAVEAAKAETRAYARRQLTWIKSNMMSWRSITAQQMEISKAKGFPLIDI